jgi:hypothetical protein
MTSEAPLGTPGPFEVRHEPSPPIPSQPGKVPSQPGKVSRVTSMHRNLQDCNSHTRTIEARENEAPRSCEEVPRRRYECGNYEVCLSLAASLNWESFTCRGCSGETNENLLWRARLTARKDSVAAKLLVAEPLTPISSRRASDAETSTPEAQQL